MGSFSYMRISALYNRAKNVNAAWSLFDRAHQIINIVFGAAVIAVASTTWHSYWDTYSWAGVAFAFLVSCFGLSLAFFLTGLGVRLWRGGQPLLATSQSIAQPLPEAAARPAPAALPFDAALYVGNVWNVSADFTKIKDEPSFTITIHISNKTDKNITVESIRGNLIFERWTLPAVSPPENMPVIAHQRDSAAFTIRQSIMKEQQDRICEVLGSGGIVKFDFSLIRLLVRVDNAERTELISIHNLDNITCRYPKDGDIICSKDVSLSAHGKA
jgi:hypothetical protein